MGAQGVPRACDRDHEDIGQGFNAPGSVQEQAVPFQAKASLGLRSTPPPRLTQDIWDESDMQGVDRVGALHGHDRRGVPVDRSFHLAVERMAWAYGRKVPAYCQYVPYPAKRQRGHGVPEDVVTRQAHDAVTQWLTARAGRAFLRLLGLRVPSTMVSLSTHLPTLEVRMEDMDVVLTWVADTRLHLEFQSAVADLTKVLLYDARRFQLERRPIRTVVVYTGAVTFAPSRLSIGSAVHRVHNFYLRALDGDAALDRLLRKTARGRGFTVLDSVWLVLAPMMRLERRTMESAALEALGMVQAIRDRDLRSGSTAAILALTRRFLSEGAQGRLRERVRESMPSLFEDVVTEGWMRGMAEGMAEGKAQGMASAILGLLQWRHREVTGAVRERIAGERNADVLQGWLLLAADADSLQAFEAGMGGGTRAGGHN